MNTNVLSSLFLGLLVVGGASSASAQWRPPVGIPAPAFGIQQKAPNAPKPWLVPTANFYYVNASAAASTDTSNANGTPAKPRKTIPQNLPAGAVVEVRGTYTYSHSSPRTIRPAGTAAKPVFIRGAAPDTKTRVTSCWEVSGSYVVIEHFEFTSCGSILFLGGSQFAALRYSDVHGTTAGGGVGIVSWDGKLLNDIVLFRNTIHDNGDVLASYDQDVHGVSIGARTSRIWVLENEIYRNSGDGVQINAGSAALQATTHHIYIGRNTAYANKQTGFWTKQAVDVILSENHAYDHRPSDSSLGACMGGQYAPEHVWFINNRVSDCDYGIQMTSDADLGTGKHQFFIGNVIHRIHDSNGGFQPGSAWQNCAISLPGGTYRYVLENTIYDVDSGVCVPNATGYLHLYDNLIQGVALNGSHLVFDSSTMLEQKTNGWGNVFAPVLRSRVSGTLAFVPPGGPYERTSNYVTTDILFANPAAGDFHLLSGSPARNNGTMDGLGIWEYFSSRYGVPLSIDIYGNSRLFDAYPDSGGSEAVTP